MNRWIRLAATLYPRSWREQYGKEFGALLDDIKPRWRVFANVLGAAIMMQMTNGTNWMKLVAATAAFGAIVATAASFTLAPHYVSLATISVTPQADPLRPASPEVIQQRAAERVAGIEAEMLSRTNLAQVVRELNLYPSERRRIPLEDILERMRGDIRIQARPSTEGSVAPIVFSVSFDYPDRVKAQAVVRDLAAKFGEANATSNRNRANMYQSFWRDQAAEATALHQAKQAAPPPPVGDTLAVLDPASVPQEPVGPDRTAFVASGLGAGLLLGLLAALAMRWPRGMRRLCGFAAAGCVIAGAASFLIPSRYTSDAVLEVTPALLTEDPLATPPAATPAAEFLRRMEPQVLSVQSLSRIIQDPRIDLYPRERAKGSMEDVVRNMLARDLRVDVLRPPSGANGATSAFNISYSYPDKMKAQAVVQRLITTFQAQHLREEKTSSDKASNALREIYQRKAGENLDVLDPASLPLSHRSPNRLLIAAIGLVIGLLAGAITLMLRPRHTPVLQPA
jgi:uncharacterized protein involved in exopolysaccharide biosynthesis